MLRCLVSALGLLAAIATAHAQSPYSVAGSADARQLETFLAELQAASRSGDRNTLATLIHYPVTVTIGGLRIPFADSGSLLERYDAIFTPALLDAIARATAPIARAQPGRVPMTVFGDGLAIGTNSVVIQPVGGRLKIVAIVVPPPEPGGQPAVSSSDTGTRAPGRPESHRIGVRAGPRPTQIAGALLRGDADVYLLWLPKGPLLEVRLDRVPGRAALVRVVHAATGVPLNPRLSDGARVITGRAPESADYRIEVRRASGGGEADALPYVLSLSLR